VYLERANINNTVGAAASGAKPSHTESKGQLKARRKQQSTVTTWGNNALQTTALRISYWIWHM